MLHVKLQNQRFFCIQPIRFVLDVKSKVVLGRYVFEVSLQMLFHTEISFIRRKISKKETNSKNEHLSVKDHVDEDPMQWDVCLETECSIPGL